MRALDPEVVDAVFAAIEPLLPVPIDGHPLGCHNPRIDDRVCFEGILTRLVVGCSWETAEQLMRHAVSDTTLRTRNNTWVQAGIFDHLADEAIAAYDRIIELDLSECSIDGSQHKAPCGGEGTGPNPTDRGRSGWKWSLLTDRAGVPFGWATNGANRHDVILFEPTLAAGKARGLVVDIETLHLDRGYDNGRIRNCVADYGIGDLICAKKRPPGTAVFKLPVPLGMRWPVERTNSWLTNYGQMRRNTDRQIDLRLAQLALAIALILTIKLIEWRNRYSPTR
jgi:transposase